MKINQLKIYSLVFFALLFGITATAQTNKKSGKNAKIEQELMQIERDWSAAYMKRDLAAVDRILADDFVGIDGRGMITDKAGEMEEFKPLPPGTPPPDRVILDDSVGEMQVRVYGDTAVVNGVTTERVSNKGKESIVKYRRTTVYVKRQGRWQCVSFHGSRIIEPPKPSVN